MLAAIAVTKDCISIKNIETGTVAELDLEEGKDILMDVSSTSVGTSFLSVIEPYSNAYNAFLRNIRRY